MFLSSHMPCAECGESVDRAAADAHTCDPARRVEYQMIVMRPVLAAFDTRFREYLSGNEGRFEAWLAARDVRRSA